MSRNQMPDQPWRCGHCYRTAGHCRRRSTSPVCDGCRQHLASKGKKFCGRCRRALALGQFQRIGQGEQRRARCNACLFVGRAEQRRAYMRQYWQANRARRLAYMRAYKARNPERIRRHARTAYINQKMRESARLRAERTS